jgi:predicted nucleic acid-binding protein
MSLDAFDADVLIYAAIPGHPLGQRVAALIPDDIEDARSRCVGSTMLIPELLTKPERLGRLDEITALGYFVVRLDLQPATEAVAYYARDLGATYGLGALDSTHLATAIIAGADRFVTNNSKDFKPGVIEEIDVIFSADLPLAE